MENKKKGRRCLGGDETSGEPGFLMMSAVFDSGLESKDSAMGEAFLPL
jgi:hypothetical protein